MKVEKRDGSKVAYDLSKISNALLKVNERTNELTNSDIDKLLTIINNKIERLKELIAVEDIQDIVEDTLMKNHFYKTAKSYILYRDSRTRNRENKSRLLKEIAEKIHATNIVNQNANVDEASFGGRKGEADSVLMKDFALNNCMSKMARDNHLNNEIYIHDLDAYAVGMHNCAKRTTKFITDKGVYSFEDFNDGDEVVVLTHTGEFKKATVRCYGKQLLNKITFKRLSNKIIYEEYFTSNHRWLLADGTVTDKLKIGDKLLNAPKINTFDYYDASDSEKYYWCLGFVLGDGVNCYAWSHGHRQEDKQFVRLRLCGDKIKYIRRFDVIPNSCKQLDNGDLYITFTRKTNFIKQFPNLDELNYNEQRALFDGLYCADGLHVGYSKSLATTNEQIANFIEDFAPSYGWYISKEEILTGKKTNYGTRGFTKNYVFLGDSNRFKYKVIKIESYKEEDVWCLEVEDNKSFVLPNGIVTGNCLSVPFDKLLSEGFNTRQTDVRPANSINTAFQLVAVIFQLQSLQQFGGVSATHLDWTMVPYVRKSFAKHFIDGLDFIMNIKEPSDTFFAYDSSTRPIDAQTYKEFGPAYDYAMKMTERELSQAVEGMYHNLNTLQSRSGNQLPFTSINYGTCTLLEGRMVTRALLEGSIKGVGKVHKTPIFPCGIFQYMKGVNDKPGTPNYDLFKLALESTSKRLYPNYANVDWSNNAGYDINDPKTYFSTMGCRTANGADINAESGTNPQTKDGRGNLAPVTIILPTLAMEADRDVEKFMLLLDEKIHEAKDMLIERYEYMCAQSPESAKFMYENGTMIGYHPEQGIRSALKHGTLVIGQIALAETLQLLVGCNHTKSEGMKLAKRIEQLFKDRCAEFKQEYRLNFGVYYTPAENLCYTAMKKFKKQYGEIPNVSDRDYFTNSIHVPVWEHVNAFEKIDIESQLTGYSNAGCITYIELDSGIQGNLEALEAMVSYAMSKDIPYFAVNVPCDECLDCGYSGQFNDRCPECGSHNIRQLRRVTGYLTGNYKTAFNYGKIKETEDRVKHV